MTRTHDISELVSRAQKGDRQSLGVLSTHVRRRVFVYLYRITLDYHLAEDLVQETILYMIESLQRLKTTSSSSLWAWIYRSAWGIFRHYIRPQGHQRVVQQTVVNHEALLQLTDYTEENPLEQAERSELFETICKSLATLQAKHRNVLVLRCFEQLSHAEIASIMGCSEVKARVLFFHAKHALKCQLHNRGYGRQYFLTGLSLFGLITGLHAKSASAAITVTSSLSKTGTIATMIGAITARLGLIRTAVVAIGLIVGTLHVCSSDADVPAESTVGLVVRGGESVLSMADMMGNTEIGELLREEGGADPAVPDPCDFDPDKSEGTRARTARQAAQLDRLADPNEIEARVERFDDLEGEPEDAGARPWSYLSCWREPLIHDNQ